jgi:hypothetical protein
MAGDPRDVETEAEREPIVLRRVDFEGDLGHLTEQIRLVAAVFRQAVDLAADHVDRGDEKAARAALDHVAGMLKFEDDEAPAADDGSERLA